MRTYIAGLLLLLSIAGVAGAEERGEAGEAGCVIRSISIQVRRRGDLYHLSAVYRNREGRRLTQEICPDQTQPSWSFGGETTSVRVLDHFGYEELVGFATAGVVTISVATTQGHFVGAPSPTLPFVVIRGTRSFFVEAVQP